MFRIQLQDGEFLHAGSCTAADEGASQTLYSRPGPCGLPKLASFGNPGSEQSVVDLKLPISPHCMLPPLSIEVTFANWHSLGLAHSQFQTVIEQCSKTCTRTDGMSYNPYSNFEFALIAFTPTSVLPCSLHPVFLYSNLNTCPIPPPYLVSRLHLQMVYA